MNTLLIKEKPDLLFNNPLKQKVYVFLKNNPGKDYETFQVLTGDAVVSRQHFNEVEQAIKSREEREKPRGTVKELSSLFLSNPTEKPKLEHLFRQNPEAKDAILKKTDKKKMNERAKQYIKEHPECTYDELVQALAFKELSKPHFFSMKTQLRKKGLISSDSRARRGRKPGSTNAVIAKKEIKPMSASPIKTIEILESIDASEFSDEVRDHYKTGVLPLLKKLLPNGEFLQMVFISDPATIELRRIVR